MQMILAKRWRESSVRVKSDAPLAATVMMGRLLEGLLLAKINQLASKSSVFNAAAIPKDAKTGKATTAKGMDAEELHRCRARAGLDHENDQGYRRVRPRLPKLYTSAKGAIAWHCPRTRRCGDALGSHQKHYSSNFEDCISHDHLTAIRTAAMTRAKAALGPR